MTNRLKNPQCLTQNGKGPKAFALLVYPVLAEYDSPPKKHSHEVHFAPGPGRSTGDLTMETKSFTTTVPLGVHEKTLADPGAAFGTADQSALIIWCARNRTGAIYDMAGRSWMMWCPVTFDVFMGLLIESGKAPPEGPAFKAWKQARRDAA